MLLDNTQWKKMNQTHIASPIEPFRPRRVHGRQVACEKSQRGHRRALENLPLQAPPLRSPHPGYAKAAPVQQMFVVPEPKS